MSRTFTAVVSLLVLGVSLSTQQSAAQVVGHTPLSVTIPVSPTPVPALGRFHLAYELHIVNLGAQPIRLDALEVTDGERRSLERVIGARLAARTSTPGQAAVRADAGPMLPVGALAVVFMWTSLPPGTAAPATIVHRLTMSSPQGRQDTLTLAPIRVHAPDAPVVASPLRGGPWVAIRGPSNTSGHRLSIVTVNGRARIPQRFAVDWARLGDDGRLFHGDSATNAAWYGYADTVFAALPGRVVVARDGIEDNTPFASVPALVEAQQATGNLLVVEGANGQFAAYAHLKPGSLRVKAGDRVVEGQPIAQVGNSGNTLGPHLHFQIGDAPELLGSEGLPFVMRGFQLVGRVQALGPLLGGTPWVAVAAQPARAVNGEMPLENMVVRFEKP